MALFTRDDLLRKAQAQTLTKSAGTILAESARQYRAGARYDVFLSHSFADAKVVLGLKTVLDALGLRVYVDWIDDPQLDRSKVTRATAAALRERMRSCSALLYAFSPNAANSKWMPWELGYFDAYRGRVAVVPVVETPVTTFVGHEYVGLYPYVDQRTLAGVAGIWVNEQAEPLKLLKQWLNG